MVERIIETRFTVTMPCRIPSMLAFNTMSSVMSTEAGYRADMGIAPWGPGNRVRARRLGRARGAHDIPSVRVRVVHILHLLSAASEAEAERLGGELRAWIFVHLVAVVVRTGHVWGS